MAWAYFDGRFSLCPLDYNDAAITVKALQNDPAAIGLSPFDAQMLIGLDPFASGGPNAALPADRFDYRKTYEYAHGAKIHLSDTTTRETTDETTHAEYTTQTDKWEPGPIFKFRSTIPDGHAVLTMGDHPSQAVEVGA